MPFHTGGIFYCLKENTMSFISLATGKSLKSVSFKSKPKELFISGGILYARLRNGFIYKLQEQKKQVKISKRKALFRHNEFSIFQKNKDELILKNIINNKDILTIPLKDTAKKYFPIQSRNSEIGILTQSQQLWVLDSTNKTKNKYDLSSNKCKMSQLFFIKKNPFIICDEKIIKLNDNA